MTFWLGVGVIIGIIGIMIYIKLKEARDINKEIEQYAKPDFVSAADLPRKVKYDALRRISPQYTREHIGEPHIRWYQDDYILAQRMTQKIRDLQDQLIRHNQAVDGFQLEPKDVVRYEAMVEILKSMMQK